MFKILLLLFSSCLLATAVFAGEVNIPADRDATLIEDAGGDVANGSGPNLWVGRTNQTALGIRRGLLRFDVAAALPANAVIDGVVLRLYQNSGNSESGAISLHRVLDDWGEGKSSKTGGRGAPAEADDATWLHTFYDQRRWTSAGGHFFPAASTTEMVTDNNYHIWKNTGTLADDVRLWLHEPQQNFGWLLRGDEDTRGSVKRFASREAPATEQRPVLTIDYHLPGK